MEALYRYLATPEPCSYLPDELARLEYVGVARLDPEEYGRLMLDGWRRFGRSLFRPRCPSCDACRSLRIDVAGFRPDRSQRRAWKVNAGVLGLEIGRPRGDPERLDLHDRFHRQRADARGWASLEPADAAGYRVAFLDNPFPAEEWTYRLDGALVGVGYVDPLSVGLSAVYFYHDPDHLARSPGTFNVLKLVEQAAIRGLPHVYLGYHVARCGSLAYKARFRPHEVLGPDGAWSDGAAVASAGPTNAAEFREPGGPSGRTLSGGNVSDD